MPIGILNNIASLAAENQLTITNNNLNSTLQQLSSGSRINSGADDPAGLAIANGLEGNISALTQSASNASDGVGALQVADGSLSEVTSLLNRAVTLATESANGTVSSQQRLALDQEYQQIQTEINQIGSNTTFNGTQVFTSTPTSIFISDGTGNTSQSSNFITANVGTLTAAGLLGGQASAQLALNGLPSAGDAITIGGTTYTFAAAGATDALQTNDGGANDATAANTVLIDNNANTATALQNTLQNLVNAINGGPGAGVTYGSATTANADATAAVSGNEVTLSATTAGNNAIAAGGSIATTVGTGTVEAFLNGATFSAGSTSNLQTAQSAQTALAAIDSAIASVAATRGQIGAVVNRLNAASDVINNQVQNLTSAENSITAADVPTAVAKMTSYSILEQTGISALAQANQQQQLVLKLLQ